MSDTPRTDTEASRFVLEDDLDDIALIPMDFASQLERELNEAKERIKRLEEARDGLIEHLLIKVDKCKNCHGFGQNNDGEGFIDEACPDCEEDRIALALFCDKAKEAKP